MASFRPYRNFQVPLRTPGIVLGQWYQGQKGQAGIGRGFAVQVINKSGSDIAADKLVAIDTTMDTTTNLPKIVLANNSTVGHNEIYVTYSTIKNNKTGIVWSGGLSGKTLNTNAAAAGTQIYLDSTSGGFTTTIPTGVNQRVIPVGYIITQSSTVGQVTWDIQAAELFVNNALVATGTISSASVTATTAGNFGHAAGVVLVAAPAAGKAIVVENVVASYKFGTAAYTGGGNVNVQYSTGSVAITGTVGTAGFAAATVDKPVAFVPLAATGNAIVGASSVNLVSASAYTQPGTAAGVINWTITYQVVSL